MSLINCKHLAAGMVFFSQLLSQLSQAQAPTSHSELLSQVPEYGLETAIRLNYMTIDMPKQPDLAPTMGLAGLHYQLKLGQNWYTGVAMHAALLGDQGGLFTLGAEIGLNYPLTHRLFLDANVHFGGGGGYRNLINDGGFINSNIGLGYQFEAFDIGLQHSYLDFYSGIIADQSLSLFVQIPLQITYAPYAFANQRYQRQGASTWQQQPSRSAYLIRFDYLFPFAGSKNDRNHHESPLRNTLHVLGFEYQHHINEPLFAFVHTDAIYKGLTAGFMDLYIGLGYQMLQTQYGNLYGKFALGAAGGRIAPEGGLTAYPSLGADIHLSDSLGISPHLGYVRALDGGFETYAAGASLKYRTGQAQLASASSLDATGLTVSLQNQSYLQANRMRQAPIDLQLIALQVNYDLNAYSYLAGQASFAYHGESGGYADGMAGIGVQSHQLISRHAQLYSELLIGAGGGGGIDTDEGIVIKPKVGIVIPTVHDISLLASIGKIMSPMGNLNATNLNIGIQFSGALLSAD